MKDNKCLILKYEGKILWLLYRNNRLVQIKAEEEDIKDSILGNIYVAKVKNVVKNIQAAFVEIAPGYHCFLGLNDLKTPLLINRKYDGRILAGDEIIVQVHKEAVKTKPPAVTCHLSLDGKYCAVSNGRPGLAFSSKLSAKVKQRIKEQLYDMEAFSFSIEDYSRNFGIVIRTNAKELGSDMLPLAEEIRQFTGKLKEIIHNGFHRTCYSLLLKKPAGYLAGLRDLHDGQCDEIVTDEAEIYEQIMDYAKEHPMFQFPPVRLYEDKQLPLYKLYSVESGLKEALGRKVWLKSGGYLIIEPTEALTVIDVNTGKITSSKTVAENHFQTNMEAAREIALQMTLRNLSGIIIVDFINMESEEHRKELMAHFGNLLKQDPVRTTLVDITALGLVEITRMKISKPLSEQLR